MDFLTPIRTAVVSVLPSAGLIGRLVALSTNGQLYADNGSSWRSLMGREVLADNRTYYVATTGADSNTGLVPGSPFRTIQKAMDVIATLDIAIYDVNIQLADGTYSESVVAKQPVGAGKVTLLGNTSTPANTIVSAPSGHTIKISGAASLNLASLRLTSVSAFSSAVYCDAGATCYIGDNVDFGAAISNHVAAADGGIVFMLSPYTISGSAANHVNSSRGGFIAAYGSNTVTLIGTPAFAGAFAIANGGDMLYFQKTFAGAATGKKYSASLNGVINTNGAGVGYLPGSIAGTTATGGQYA